MKNILLHFEYPFETEELREKSISNNYKELYYVIKINFKNILGIDDSNEIKTYLKEYVEFLESGNSDIQQKNFYDSFVKSRSYKTKRVRSRGRSEKNKFF